MDRRDGMLRLVAVLCCTGCTMGPMDFGGAGGSGGGGGGYSPIPCNPPTSVAITPGEDSVEVGRAIPLQLSAQGATGLCASRWWSSDSTVVTIGYVASLFSFSEPITVNGVSPGTATVTVDVGGKTATALVRVGVPRSSFVSVTAGCVGASDGSTLCWGFNNSLVPMRVPGGSGFATLSAGPSRACGLSATGAAYCWGWIWSGAPPVSISGSYHPAPVPVNPGVRFIAMDAGQQFHACALKADSSAVCWGDNSYGQLGIGSLGDVQVAPQPVAGGLLFASVTAGSHHTCALTGAGAAYCWGMAFHGQTGNGQMGPGAVYPAAPVAVSGGLNFQQVSAGDSHTCGLTASGTAYCWGLNEYGQLGTGDTVRVSVPHAVAGALSFTSVGAGESHSCGLTASGEVYCWGIDYLSPASIALVPTRVVSAVRFGTLRVSGLRTCGLADDGRAYCWGFAGLGDGSSRGSATPVRVSGQP